MNVIMYCVDCSDAAHDEYCILENVQSMMKCPKCKQCCSIPYSLGVSNK